MARERAHDAGDEGGRHGQRSRRRPVRRHLSFDRSVAARSGIPDPYGREQSLHAAGRRPAPDRARPARRTAAARRPDGGRARTDAFEPSRHPQRRVFAHAVLLRHQRSTFGPLSHDHAERHARMDQQQRHGDQGSRQDTVVGSGIASAADLQRQCQPRPREDRQGAAGGDQAGVPAGAAQRRRRGEQRPYAVPVGPREGRSAGTADRSAGARRGEHGTADEA